MFMLGSCFKNNKKIPKSQWLNLTDSFLLSQESNVVGSGFSYSGVALITMYPRGDTVT